MNESKRKLGDAADALRFALGVPAYTFGPRFWDEVRMRFQSGKISFPRSGDK